MISDNLLLKIAVISSIIGFIGLFFFQPSTIQELEEISVNSVNKADNGYVISFTTNKTYSGYSEKNISIGKYLVLLQRGGNDFYYISSSQKVNGSN